MPKWRYNSNIKSGIAQHVLHKGQSLNLPHENLTCLSRVHWHTGLSQRRLEFVLLTPSQLWRLYQGDNCCETIPYRKRNFPNKNEKTTKKKKREKKEKKEKHSKTMQYQKWHFLRQENISGKTQRNTETSPPQKWSFLRKEKHHGANRSLTVLHSHWSSSKKKHFSLFCFCSMLRTLWQPAIQQFSKPTASGPLFARQITKSKTKQVSVLTRGHSYWNRSRRVARSIEIESEAGLSLLHSPTSLSISFPAVTQIVKNDPILMQNQTSLSISVTLTPFLMDIFENGQQYL